MDRRRIEKTWRMTLAVGLWACFCGPVAACVTHDPPAAVSVILENSGTTAMRCQLRFAHWVDRDLGMLEGGRAIEFPVSQDANGALYVMRSDGKRRMMIETIQCWRSDDWYASFDQIDLAPARITRPKVITASCTVPETAGRVTCNDVKLQE